MTDSTYTSLPHTHTHAHTHTHTHSRVFMTSEDITLTYIHSLQTCPNHCRYLPNPNRYPHFNQHLTLP